MTEEKAKLQSNFAEDIFSTTELMGTLAEFRNADSFTHVRHVKAFTEILLGNLMKLYPEYRLSREQIEKIANVSGLHDIGKIQIPDSILLKPGRLEPEEFELIKLHTIYGQEIMETVPFTGGGEDVKRYCLEIARSHHERYDGKGYPDGLYGEDIPISAQAVSVTEAFDALISERIHKAAYSLDKSYQMILEGSCGVFNPKILAAFRVSRPEIENYLENEAAGESVADEEIFG